MLELQKRHFFTALLALSVVAAPALSAQRPVALPGIEGATQLQSPADRPTRFDVNISLLTADPRGEFRENIGTGFGIGGNVRYRLDRRGILSLRADLLGTQYGSEMRRVPLSSTIGGRILVDLTTANTLGALSFGPQLTAPAGPVRPYLNGSISVVSLATTSSVKGTNSYDQDFASTQNFADNTSAWVGGGGILIPIGPGHWNGFLDIGARYHNGGEASYLREGSISDNPDGSISYTPLRSRTPFVVYQLGMSFNLRSNSVRCPSWVCM